nr:hypothetical protein [Tanacetum cinerariifolium]
MMLNDAIKQSESYQMFIKYFTSQIPLKRSEAKVHKERRLLTSLMKQLMYLKSLNLNLLRKRLVVEIREAADTMQALKESKKTIKRQPGTGGLSEGTDSIPTVLDESTLVSATSHEGTDTKPGVPDKEKDIFEANKDKDGDFDDEGDDHINDTQDTDDEDAETESDEDEIHKYKICVRKDVDVEMAEPKIVEHENKEKDVMTDVAKPDNEKNAEEKGDAKNAENTAGSNYQVKESTKFPLLSSSLSLSSGFSTQLINSYFDISLTGVLKDSAEANVSSLMDIHIKQETPLIQSPSVQKVLESMISKTTNLLPVSEILTESLASTHILPPQVTPTITIMQQTTSPIPTPPITIESPTITTIIPESDALTVVRLRVTKLVKDVSELKNINLFTKDLATLKSQVPNVVDDYIGSKLGDALQKTLQKHFEDLIQKHFGKPAPEEQAEKKNMPKYTIKSTDKAALKSEAPKGKTSSKGSKTGKSASAKEPVEEQIVEVVMNDTGEDMVRDDDQPQDTLNPKIDKTPNLEWFKQPPRLPAPDSK